MTDFVVTTSEDVANGDLSPDDLSLREAIALANGNVGKDRITFADGVDHIALADALPVIVDDLVLVGGGHLTLDANADGDADPGTHARGDESRRCIDIQGSVKVVIDGLSLTGGSVQDGTGGGGIRALLGAKLQIVDSEIAENWSGSAYRHTSRGDGGGVFVEGTCVIVDSVIHDNRARGHGGGVAVVGELDASGSRIADNHARYDGGGIFTRGSLTLSHVVVAENKSSWDYARGGGIFADGDMNVRFSRVVDNYVYGWGGGIYATGAAEVESSLIAGNRARGGYDIGGSAGGIFAHAVRLVDSEVSGNVGGGRASAGGGITAHRVELESSAVVNNSSFSDYGRGGGIAATVVAARDSTIAWNFVEGFYDAYGGGIFARRSLDLNGVTLTGNRVTTYGSDSSSGGGAVATLKGHGSIWNSLIVGNRSDEGRPVMGDVTRRSSIVEDDGRAIFADVTKIGKGLFAGDLGNNGGPTPTVALLWHRHNPAIGGADPDHASDRDQRGVARDNHPDLGALEAMRRAGIVLVGGEGTDMLRGTEARDRLDASGGNDDLRGLSGGDVLLAGAGDDELLGGGGKDMLDGWTGDDVLIGGRQDDLLRGGTGHDLFVMTPAFGRDTIEDFDARPANGQDRIDLRALGITAASFAQSVGIDDLGNYTWVTIGVSYIRCSGVDGEDGNVLTIDDFVLLR